MSTNTTTFRAAYFIADQQSTGILLTTEDHSAWSDDALRAEAKAEAMRAGLIGDDIEANQVSEEDFGVGLRIGQYTL